MKTKLSSCGRFEILDTDTVAKPPVFDEKKLGDEIARVWGEHGAHMDVYRTLLVERSLREQKLADQVRDTCKRAEDAEGALRLARSALRQWTEKYAHLQNECGERVSRVLDYNLPPADHLRALEAIEEHFKAGPYASNAGTPYVQGEGRIARLVREVEEMQPAELTLFIQAMADKFDLPAPFISSRSESDG